MSTENVTEAVATQATEAGQSAPAPGSDQQQAIDAAATESGQAAHHDDDDSDAGESQSREPRKRPRWSDVNQARRDADAARREAELWRQQALGQQSPQARATPAPTTPVAAKPTLEQFDFDQDAYEDAVFEWRLADREAKSKQTQAVQQLHKAREKFDEAQADFAATHEDYDDVVMHPDLQVTEVMGHAMQASDIGPHIAYHLGKNPAEAARIAALHPLQQAIAIGRIESELAAKGAKPRPPKPKQTTNAPPPPPSVRTSVPVKKSEADLTDEERVEAIRAARYK